MKGGNSRVLNDDRPGVVIVSLVAIIARILLADVILVGLRGRSFRETPRLSERRSTRRCLCIRRGVGPDRLLITARIAESTHSAAPRLESS
jgi:hypothetical protein